MPRGAEASVVAVDRTGYAAKQAALLEALLRGGELPEGFAAPGASGTIPKGPDEVPASSPSRRRV